MKGHDLDSVISDVKRMKSILNNTKSLNAVLEFLENNTRGIQGVQTKNSVSISSQIQNEDRNVTSIRSVKDGLNEKSIIRTDTGYKSQKHKLLETNKVKDYDRCVNITQSMTFGLNEKSIVSSTDQSIFIKTYYYELLELLKDNNQATIYEELRDHYTSIHPTQKPVRLLERLLMLVLPKDKSSNKVVVADWFGGSYSTMKAVHNLGLKGVSTEILKEYHDLGIDELKSHCKQLNLF